MRPFPCGSCGEAIILASRPDGRKIALNATPHPRGDWAMDATGCTGPRGLTDRPLPALRYTAHYTTCGKQEKESQ